MSILHGPPGGPERRVSLSPAPRGTRVVDGSHTPAQALGTAAKQEWGGLHVLALPTFQVCGCRAPGMPPHSCSMSFGGTQPPALLAWSRAASQVPPRSWECVPDSHPGREPAMIGSMVQEGVSPWQDLPLPAPGRDKMSEGRDAGAGCTLGEAQGLQAPGSGVGHAGQGPWAGVCPQGEVCQCPTCRMAQNSRSGPLGEGLLLSQV